MPGFEFCVAGTRFLMRSRSRILHGFEGKRRGACVYCCRATCAKEAAHFWDEKENPQAYDSTGLSRGVEDAGKTTGRNSSR